MKQTAKQVFRQPPVRLNCAQAVAHAWNAKTGQGPELVPALASCGGGRAPGGLCGALHAVHRIVGSSQGQAEATAAFAVRAGAVGCHEIRKLGQASCEACVEHAAEWLERYGKTGDSR